MSAPLFSWRMGVSKLDKWLSWGLGSPGFESRQEKETFLVSKHKTSSGDHPAYYSIGIRSNVPRAGAEGLTATRHWPLNVSSPEVENKWSYTSTPLPGLHFMDRDNFTITAHFVLNCVRNLIPKDYGLLLKFYDFVQHWSKLLASTLLFWGVN